MSDWSELFLMKEECFMLSFRLNPVLLGLFVLSSILSVSAVHAGPGCKVEKGAISGYKFNDLNGNGVDDNEPRLPGFTVLLSSLGSIPISRSTVTNEMGEFSFLGLPLQSYEVCEVAPLASPPWVPTTPECVEVSLTCSSPFAEVVFGNEQEANDEGCVRTQGFWGNSPAGQELLAVLVPGVMALGTVNYTAVQLDSILDAPVAGNALLILAHQLIPANLNILAGADSSPVAATIASANTALGALVIPPVGAASVAPNTALGQTMVGLAEILDNYNNGNLGVPSCPEELRNRRLE